MTFRNYLKRLCTYVFSSTIVLGAILGVAVLIPREGSMNLDIDFDFDALNGFSLIFGLPMIAVLLFALLSPLSFWIHRLLAKKATEEIERGA